MEQDGKDSGYVKSFISASLPSLEEVSKMKIGSEQGRGLRKIQVFWAILSKAGFPVDEQHLRGIAPTGKPASKFDPGFNEKLRKAAYKIGDDSSIPPAPQALGEMVREYETINRFRRENPNDKLINDNGKAAFDPDDIALFEFLEPMSGRSGTTLIQPYRMYHDPQAGDFIKDVLKLLDKGQTVILDLGNAHPMLMSYFSEILSKEVFAHQLEKFSADKLGGHYIQIYFEEAHNLFPRKDDATTIYSRFAKEGAKYHIGMVYSTQSPTTISSDLLAQTENFFIAHLSSQDEVNALARVNVAYESLKDDILRAKTTGYIRMLTRSHRFVVPVQARKFQPVDGSISAQ